MFSGYVMTSKIEIVERKDLIVQLESNISSIKNLLGYLLNEMRGFKFQITVKVLFKKYKPNGKIEFALVYFNSWQEQWLITDLIYKILFKKFYIWLMFGLMEDLVGLLNQLSLNTY